MKIVKFISKILLWLVGTLLALLLVLSIYIWRNSDFKEPKITTAVNLQVPRTKLNDSCYQMGNNWLRKNEFGLFEMFTTGAPYERGYVNGKLSQELLVYQEEVFTQQIKEMVPSASYLKFLKYVIGFMNRDLPEHVSDEYKQEIYGISQSADTQFNWIGTNYSRQLNYHAAHDIGHALQNLMLVGCTSFSAWDSKTADGALLVGRNFDFYMGDDFAKNKIVSFVQPDKGHKFAFVTWGGFIGVVSGINDQGLTVTINAARSAIPTGAATPVSLVAREILQYAGNIAEAIAIARSRTMFVSESFLIASARDHKSIIIEKTPDTLAVYDAASDYITCANHYQSQLLSAQTLNKEQMVQSASVYRFNHTKALIQEQLPLTPQKIAGILRNTTGINERNIGLGNEKSINQLLAHHAIIFMPDSLRMWVSTHPWQSGTFVCYDLNKVFGTKGLQSDTKVASSQYNIAADTVFLNSIGYASFLKFKGLKQDWLKKKIPAPESIIESNPEYYDAYRIAGDMYLHQGKNAAAIAAYQTALTKEIATEQEKIALKEKILNAQKSSKK